MQHAEDKQSLYQAALELRNVLRVDKAQTTDAKLAVSLQAARAAQKNNMVNLNQALRSYPRLLDFFEGPELRHHDQLHRHIEQL